MRPEIEDWILAYLDGTLEGEELRLLEEALRSDAEARELFRTHAALETNLRKQAEATGSDYEPWLQPTRSNRSLVALWPYAMVAAATFLISLPFFLFALHSKGDGSAQSPEYVATLYREENAVWRGGSTHLAGDRLPPQSLKLQSGFAEIAFGSGVRLVLEAPAKLRLQSESSALLQRGKVVFHGDDAATPFDLSTPQSSLVDFGTEYAVFVEADGAEEVHVFDGEVWRTELSGNENSDVLRAGDAWKYTAAQSIALPLGEASFVRSLGAPAKSITKGEPLIAWDTSLNEGFQDNGQGWTKAWEQFRSSGGDRPVRVRQLARPIDLSTHQDYYFSLRFRLNAQDAGPVFINLRSSDEGVAQDSKHRVVNILSPSSGRVLSSFNGSSRRTHVTFQADTDYILIGRLMARSQEPDQLFLHLAPASELPPLEPPHWTLISAPGDRNHQADLLAIKTFNRSDYQFQEVRFGTSWAAVTQLQDSE